MYTIYSDENIDINIEIDSDIERGVFIHTHVKKFSLSMYKNTHKVFKEICEELKLHHGVDYILALPPGEKEQKWQEHFGLTYTGIKVNKLKLMRIYL